MKFRFERTLAVLGAATILVIGFDGVTYAATGSSLILGHINKASATTTVQNTGSGPALNLLTKSAATAPFTTNGKGLVKNLYASRAANADTLGGQSAAALKAAAQPEVWTAAVEKYTTTVMGGNEVVASVDVPAGTYVVDSKLYSIGQNPPYQFLCYLYSGSSYIDLTDSAPTSAYGPLSMMGTTTVTGPTTLSVQCNGNGNAIDVWFTKLIATRVSVVH